MLSVSSKCVCVCVFAFGMRRDFFLIVGHDMANMRKCFVWVFSSVAVSRGDVFLSLLCCVRVPRAGWSWIFSLSQVSQVLLIP